MAIMTLEIESEDELRALQMALENIDGFLEDTALDSLHLSSDDIYGLAMEDSRTVNLEMRRQRKEANNQLDLLLATKTLLRKIK